MLLKYRRWSCYDKNVETAVGENYSRERSSEVAHTRRITSCNELHSKVLFVEPLDRRVYPLFS